MFVPCPVELPDTEVPTSLWSVLPEVLDQSRIPSFLPHHGSLNSLISLPILYEYEHSSQVEFCDYCHQWKQDVLTFLAPHYHQLYYLALLMSAATEVVFVPIP